MWKTPCKKEPMLPVSHQRIGETYVHTIQPHTRERRKHPYLAYRMFWNTPDLLHSEDYPGFPTDAEEITDLTVRCASTCMWKGTVMGSRDRADFRMYVNRRIKERYGDIMSTSWITALSYLKRIPSVNRQISLSGRNMPRVWFLCVLLADKFCDDVTKSWCMTDWSYMAGNICPVSWWRNNERALCHLLNWDCAVSPDGLRQLVVELRKLAPIPLLDVVLVPESTPRVCEETKYESINAKRRLVFPDLADIDAAIAKKPCRTTVSDPRVPVTRLIPHLWW